MKDPMMTKELEKKIRRFIKINKESIMLMDEIKAEMCEKDDDCKYMYDPFITEEVLGEEQGDNEYCDQSTGYWGDDYHGIYYYPLPGGKKWVGFHYDM